MDKKKKEGIKVPLLAEDAFRSEEQDDFKSCNSGDEDSPREIRSKFNGSINSNGNFPANGIEDHKIEENNKEESKDVFVPNINNSPKDTSQNQGRQSSNKSVKMNQRTKKKPKKTIWNEIIDFIVFCYEFMLIM